VGVSLIAGAALGLGLPDSAVAGATSIITVSAGDGLAISGSKIQCGVSANSGYGLPLAGKTYVACGPSTQVRGGGYVALIVSDGRVVILSVRTQKAVFSYAPRAVAYPSAFRAARIGDVIVLDGTSIVCDVIKASGVPTLICELVDSKGIVHPNSYSFAISDALVSSLRWDPARQVHVLQSWPER
jgi:hypothetical protein